jgi:hypothetical protein
MLAAIHFGICCHNVFGMVVKLLVSDIKGKIIN